MPRSTKIRWDQLTGKISGLKPRLSEILILGVALQAISLSLPLFTQWIIDSAISSGDDEFLVIIIFSLGAALFLKMAMEFAANWANITLTTQFGTQWSIKVVQHLIKIPLEWFSTQPTGEIISKFQSMQQIQNAITTKFTETLADSIFVAGTLVVISIYSIKLTVIAIIATFLYACIRIVSLRKFRKYSQAQLISDAAMQTAFVENLQCIQTIKIAQLEERRTDNWIQLLLNSTENSIRVRKFSLGFALAHSFVQNLETILILGLGAAAVISQNMTLGMLIAFLAYKAEFSTRAQRVVNNYADFQLLKIHSERLSDIVNTPAEKIENHCDQKSPRTFSKIEVKNLGFKHSASNSWLFRNLSFTIDSGDRIVITGPTGSGKSTFAKILLGLLQPSEGAIEIDGKDISEIGISQWRAHFSAVTQDDQLFSATIKDNITHYNPKIDERRIIDAAKTAQIHAEIEQMPKKYDTFLQARGSNISGGQKQRIFIARAICNDAPVVVFDEATSHLDVSTEKSLNNAIEKLSLTAISIAHRAETIQMAGKQIDLSAYK